MARLTRGGYGAGMTIQFVDPRGLPSRPADPYAHSMQLKPESVVGLLANNFPGSVAFLDELESAMQAQYPQIKTKRYAKPNASDTATTTLMSTIESECDGLITAYGH
jgi:hypothetical protein